MSQDETIKALLASYEKTAQKLMDGVKISEDEMYRFMGLTGVLSVQLQRQLWTQEELREQIEALQTKRCETCPNSKVIASLQAAAAQQGHTAPPAAAPESPQNIKTMMLTALAQNMRTLIITAGAVILLLGLAVTFTRQINEAAGFVDHTSQAVKENRK